MQAYRDQYNMVYYNQLLRADKKVQSKRISRNTSFTSQKVEISDYLYTPDDWEGFFYTLYFTFIPYIAGATFLFFTVAGGDYGNFKLLDMSAFLIVWIIGYEIVATFLLAVIFIAFLRFKRNL